MHCNILLSAFFWSLSSNFKKRVSHNSNLSCILQPAYTGEFTSVCSKDLLLFLSLPYAGLLFVSYMWYLIVVMIASL